MTAALVVALTAAWAVPARAQPATPSVDARLLARADSITVGDYCAAVRGVLAPAAVRTALGDALEAVAHDTTHLCDARASRATLRWMLGDRPATLAQVARVESRDAASAAPDVIAAMDDLYRVLRGDDVRPVIAAAAGDSANRAFVRVAETAHGLLVLQARDAALDRLGRYERKLGPHSAPLNGVEVLLNYAAQRYAPGFSATAAGGPSPWEIVAAYVPDYATMVGGRAQAASASEFGFRRYLFGKRFAASGWRGVLLPGYWSAGALVANDRPGALVWPGEGRSRVGGFVSWGAVKVGYVPGRTGAWLVTKQLQVVRFVF